ncbi:UNVERIFIED_CONTAM: Acyl-coenzyme A thioesterase 13 [Gekko kuhli]
MSHLTVQSLRQIMKSLLDSPGFDRVLNKMTVLSASAGKVVCEMKVEEEHTNRGGTLHGGLTATLVDVVSTAALMYTERQAPGVSVDMNISYMSAAKIGDEILITAEVLKQVDVNLNLEALQDRRRVDSKGMKAFLSGLETILSC